MAGTVSISPLMMTFDDIKLFLHVDQFYVFSPRAVSPPLTTLPASELMPEFGLVGVAFSCDNFELRNSSRSPVARAVSVSGSRRTVRLFPSMQAYAYRFYHLHLLSRGWRAVLH